MLKGFTYPGGLSRHEREVHKKHGPQTLFMCRDQECKRSSNGFTREENLKQHVERVHKKKDKVASDDEVRLAGGNKRRRNVEGDYNDEDEDGGRQRKRMRREMPWDFMEESREMKDELRDLRAELRDNKNEMREMKDELRGLRAELRDNKNETRDLKEEVRQLKDGHKV